MPITKASKHCLILIRVPLVLTEAGILAFYVGPSLASAGTELHTMGREAAYRSVIY